MGAAAEPPAETAEEKSTPTSKHETTAGALDREGASQYLGVSHATIRLMQNRGQLKGFQREGKWWFTIDELNEHKKVPHEAALLDACKGLLLTAHAHIEKMLGLSADPMGKLFSMLKEDKEQDRKRIGELEVRVVDQLSTFEKVLSQQHEREMMRLDHEAKNRRMDKAMERFLSFAPLATHWVAGKLGLRGDVSEYEAIGQFLESFSDAEILAMVEKLPQEKQLVLMGLYGEFKKRKEAATKENGAGPDVAKTNGTASTEPPKEGSNAA